MSKLELMDDFGTRMKYYEAAETERKFDPALPIYARIDGRSFSRFTHGMQRPFDPDMRAAMAETTKYLVDKTHAKIGYTQSDEISLVWQVEDGDNARSQMFFAGKVQKLVSVITGMATAKFMHEITRSEKLFAYSEKLPHFDARVISLPSQTEAANMILWRAMDARKNSISTVAQSLYSAKELFGCDQGRMLRMIADKGVDFESYPAGYRRGIFVRRRIVMRVLTDAELLKIPLQHRPTGPVPRGVVEVVDMPPFNRVMNRNEVIFKGADPLAATVPQ